MGQRLGVGVVVVAALLVCGRAGADQRFVAKTQVYVDSDHTTVVSPLVGVTADAWRGGTIGVNYVADVVSSASIDVVSNATKQMTDVRSEVTGNVTQKFRDTTLGASYIYSAEHDYWSHTLSVSLAQDLFQKNTTLAIGYSLSLNDVGRTGDLSFHRALGVHGVEASFTQTLTPATIMQLSYTFGYLDGYQANPYRFVTIEGPDGSIDFKVPETDPAIRVRHAFVAALNRHLGHDSSLQADYRLYLDSWGIVAHTAQLRYFVNLGPVTLRLRERFYYQKGADFFQPHYTEDTIGPFMTADRELSTFWSNVVGAKLTYHPSARHRALGIELKADVFYFSYLDFALLRWRAGANLGAGLDLAF